MKRSMRWLGCWVVGTVILLGSAELDGAADSYGRPSPVTSASARSWLSEPGPWGTMRVSVLRLVPPDPLLAKVTFKSEGEWIFLRMSWAEIDGFLSRAQLTPAQLVPLLQSENRRESEDGKSRIIRVTDELRWGLGPESRRIIYDELASFEPNVTHALPLLAPTPERLARANLQPAVLDALRQLTFYRGPRACIVDADLIAALITDPAEMMRFKRVMLSYPSLSVELTRASLARREEVNQYWSKPGGKPVTGLLRAFDRSPELETLDLIHLLPPLPRKVLHTFPDGGFAPLQANCFWMSLNFFNPVPDLRYLPGADDFGQAVSEAMQALQRDYVPVRPPFRFGDVIALFSDSETSRELVHMVVYIADNIVLTKNGRVPTSPFVLMTFGDIEKTYPWPMPLNVRGYRLRSVAP